VKCLVLVFILSVLTPGKTYGADPYKESFQLKVLNKSAIISIIQIRRQYYQHHGSLVFLNSSFSEGYEEEVACRFEWGDEDRKIVIPDVLTSLGWGVKRESSITPFFQAGFGFAESPAILACSKRGNGPISLDEILSSLEGIVSIVTPSSTVASTKTY
jgi:hypothetical protein